MVSKDDIGPLINRYRSPGNFLHAVRLMLRYAFDRMRYRRGTRLTMGNALVARLYYSLKQRNVPVLFDTPLADLITSGDRITGAVVGAGKRIRARIGVVSATGGFARNQTYRERYLPQPARPWSMAPEENSGDGIVLAEGLGARISADKHPSGGFWSPVSVTRRRNGSTGLYPHLSLDRAKPGLIAVNSAGRRFVNEAVSYHDFVEAMYRSHETVDTMPAWLICDSRFVRRYGLGAIKPGERRLKRYARDGYITIANTIEILAREINVDPKGLSKTVSRSNHQAEEGVDHDFDKGGDTFNQFNGDPENTPNPCLGPIRSPPYVAIAVWPAEIGCSVGLSTTVDGEVLRPDGEVIRGLYACGNDMSSIMSGTYPGPGITLGPAVVFGYRVAMHALRCKTTA